MLFEIDNSDTLQSALKTLCSFLAEKKLSEDCVFDCKLVVYELVGNVLRHSGGVAKLRSDVGEGFVKLEVFSSVPFVPPKESRCSDVFAENGRGLFIVDKVCEERICTPDGVIKVKIKIK